MEMLRKTGFGVGLAWMLLLSAPAGATPPDLLCLGQSADGAVGFEFSLPTNYSGYYKSGVMPLSLAHAWFEFGKGAARRPVEFFSENIIAQWLADGRVDMRLLKEEETAEGETLTHDLIIRTRSTGRYSGESGQLVHKGTFVFRVHQGKIAEGGASVVLEVSGEAECG